MEVENLLSYHIKLLIAISVPSLSLQSSWIALHLFPSLGVSLLWLLHSFSEWFTLSHHENLLPSAGHLFGTCEFPWYLEFMRVSLLVNFALSNVLFFLLPSNWVLVVLCSEHLFWALLALIWQCLQIFLLCWLTLFLLWLLPKILVWLPAPCFAWLLFYFSWLPSVSQS